MRHLLYENNVRNALKIKVNLINVFVYVMIRRIVITLGPLREQPPMFNPTSVICKIKRRMIIL
jgi:hypothetical protein